MPTQFLGTVQRRNPLSDLFTALQPMGQMLGQHLAGEPERKRQEEEEEKKKLMMIAALYRATDEKGRREMEAAPGWAEFQAGMAKYGLSTMLAGVPAAPPQTLDQLKAETYGTLPLKAQQDVVTGKEPTPFEPKKHGYQWALEQYQQGNRDPEILKLVFGYEVKEVKEEKGHVLKPGDTFIDATGKVITTVPGESYVLKPGESMLNREGKVIATAPMSELQRAELVLKEKAEERLTKEGVWKNLLALKELEQTRVLKLAELDQVRFLKLKSLNQTRLLTLRDQDLTKALTLSDQALRKLLGLSDIEMQRAIAMSDQELTRFLGVEKLKVEKEKLEIDRGRLSVEEKLASIKEREVSISESYKMGMLGVAEGELVRKTEADEAANRVTMLNQRRADAALKSLDQFRKAQTAEGVARIQNMNGVLEFEKEKFNAVHEHNIAQDEFLNQLKTRVADREDAKLVLQTSIAKWNKSRDDAQLALDQLKAEQQDLLGWAEVVEAREKNRLLEQANTIKQFIADYEKEIGFIETKIKQSEFELKEWEKRQTVPAEVGLLGAQTEATIEKMKRPEAYKLGDAGLWLRQYGEKTPTLVSGTVPPEDPEKQKNILSELVGRAASAAKPTYGLVDDTTRKQMADILRSLIEVDPRLTPEIKALYKSYISQITGSSLTAGLEGEGGIVPLSGSITLDEFVEIYRSATEPSPIATPQIASVAQEAMRIYREQSIEASRQYAQSQGFTLQQIGDYLKKTRKK